MLLHRNVHLLRTDITLLDLPPQTHTFAVSATSAGGQAIKNMKAPLDTTNPVNVTDGPEERGPREEAAHANTLQSTDANSKEDRSVAPHER